MNLVPTSEPALPHPPQAGIARAVSYLTNKLVPAGTGHELPATEAPTPEQRAGLERRLGRLRAWLAPFAPSDEQRVRDELSALLATRKGTTPVGDARVIVAMYVADLADLPLHAIHAACGDFRQGRVPGDEGFRPTQAAIRLQAQRHLHVLAVESRRIEAILGARLVDRRPDAATRKASADAARAAFRIPEGGLAHGTPHARPPEGPDSVGAIAAAVTARSPASFEAWKRGQRDEPEPMPEDRFDERGAA